MAAQTFEEHKVWLEKQVPNESLKMAEVRYKSASATALREIQASEFWTNLLKSLLEWNDSYSAYSGGYLLFPSLQKPELLAKPFKSLLNKAYRKNILQNPNFPDEPVGGWLKQDTWYANTNDLVRTTIVVKYMDGVQYLTSAMSQLCDELKLVPPKIDFEARAEGYYAGHFYVEHEIEIARVDWDTEPVPIKFEIQVATQLQDAIRKLTHIGYVSVRSLEKPLDKWQWDYKDPNFAPNYLGHILHYVEGMIMEIRDRETINKDRGKTI